MYESLKKKNHFTVIFNWLPNTHLLSDYHQNTP